MRAVSDRFLETLRGSHTAVFRARVTDQFLTGVNPAGATEIPILGGNVKYKSDAKVRATLELTTSWEWPRRSTDLLTPYGNQIFVERGIEYGNGQKEYVGLGWFRIDTPEQDVVPDGEITISGSDRMAGLVDGELVTPVQFPGTLTFGQVVESLIWGVYFYAGIIEWDDTAVRDDTINRDIIAEEDRAGCLIDLITSLGKVGYWDHRGIFVIKTPPSVTGDPVWTVDAGADGVLVQMSRALTREGLKNAYVVSGEAADTTAPVRAVVYNLDPTSPTYWNGNFGKVPGRFSSPFLTTEEQCRLAAETLLRKQLGLPYQVQFAAIANAALEPYDVIGLRYPRSGGSRSLYTEKHVVDGMTVPLVPEEALDVDTREQQLELIGGNP